MILLVGAARFELTTPCAQGRFRRSEEITCFLVLTFQADAPSLLKPVERFGTLGLWAATILSTSAWRASTQEPLLLGGLKKLKRIAVRILNLDLFAPGPYFHLIAKLQSDVSE